VVFLKNSDLQFNIMITNSLSKHAAWWTIFLTAGTLIFLQAAITRILSASSDYHATFFVISTVMLGLAASSIRVYQKVHDNSLSISLISKSLLIAGIQLVLCFLIFAHIILPLASDDFRNFIFLFCATLFYWPFERAGFAIAGLLYLEKDRISWIYWGDLLGAAIAAAILVPLLSIVSSPILIFICSTILIGSALLLKISETTRHSCISYISYFCSSLLILISTFTFPSITFLPFPENFQTNSLEWDGWNSQARVAVFHDESKDYKYISSGWGFSKKFTGATPNFKWLNIDSGAGTQILEMPSETQKSIMLEYLGWDLTSLAYSIQKGNLQKVFIIGGGGGRDILTADLFGSEQIHVAELNPLVVKAVNEEFKEFSGKPYSLKNVNLQIGEGRNILSRSELTFDLIQMSMIDTFASSIAGSFALSENALYTLEAFDIYLNKLNEEGIFSLSRWWFGDPHGETARALLMLIESLKKLGINDPSSHLMVFYTHGELPLPVTTILASKTPFSKAKIDSAISIAKEKGFELLWPNLPEYSRGLDELFDPGFDIRSVKIYDLSPTTDDRPFFFNIHRLFDSWVEAFIQKDIFLGSKVTILFCLTFLILGLGCICFIYKPAKKILASTTAAQSLSRSELYGTILYFSGIGVGFMFIEIGILQKMTLFLGHPNFALSVVLFCILFFSSLGSLGSKRLLLNNTSNIFYLLLGLLIIDLTIKTFATSYIFNYFYPLPISYRILIVGTILAPGSFLMGVFLPHGLSLLSRKNKDQNIPLAWAINGIASVLGSALATLIAVSMGFTILLLFSIVFYSLTGIGHSLLIKDMKLKNKIL
jgi:hypothetical protein